MEGRQKGSGMAAGKRRGETAPELGMLAENRVAIEGIDPCIEGDRFAAKAAEGRPLRVEADVFGDGHDLFAASVQIEGGVAVLMERLLNDRWSAEIGLDRIAPRASRSTAGATSGAPLRATPARSSTRARTWRSSFRKPARSSTPLRPRAASPQL